MRLLLILAIFSRILLGAEIADSIYYNGKVITVDGKMTVAQAFAVRGNRFAAVGTNADIRKLAGDGTQKIDLAGQSVLPGLIDSHAHPIGAALVERNGPIPTFHTIGEVQSYLRKRAAAMPATEVIYGYKVYPSRLKERRYPTRYELDAAAPGRMVFLDNSYGCVLSSAALQKLNITKDTPEPKNGRIFRDKDGTPIGTILGAMELWGQMRPKETYSVADNLWALENIQKSYNAVGLTSYIDRGTTAEKLHTYQQLRNKQPLTLRTSFTYLIPGGGDVKRLRGIIEDIPFVTGFGDDWMRVGALKVVADGGMLFGTAFMREPYGTHTDIYGWHDPEYRGELSVPRENLIEIARIANELGWQMTAHTTGGGATDYLLDAYEAADKQHPIKGRRFTVTHGNFPDDRAIARAARLGVIFDSQPAWLHFDGAALNEVLGPERMKRFQPYRSLLDAGIVVAGGSDHMVRFDAREAINAYDPFFGMWMAITRKTKEGTVLNPEQRISREEALRMWTINGAYTSFDEKIKGSIEAGKLADFVVISKDYLSCPEDEIKDIQALITVVDGKVVYRRK